MTSTGPPSPANGRLVAWARRTAGAAWFRHGVTAAIATNAVVIGLDTSVTLAARFGGAFALASQTFLAIFVVEALIKMTAVWPRLRDYFGDGWNLFDFTVIAVSLLPSTGELATLARLARLFRVLRLVSALPELRLIVATLIRSVPGMFNVLALMSIIFYVYGVAGYHLFRDIDPTHWRTLGISLLSLFRIVTLEDWTDIMYTALDHYWWAWGLLRELRGRGDVRGHQPVHRGGDQQPGRGEAGPVAGARRAPDPCGAAGGAVADAGGAGAAAGAAGRRAGLKPRPPSAGSVSRWWSCPPASPRRWAWTDRP